MPCTTAIQFLLRDKHLHLSVTQRSNDAYKGLPHDVFCFTMMQEMIARRVGVEIGEYYQYVGSEHVYTKNLSDLNIYVGEGYQKLAEMPPMPLGDPFEQVPSLLDCERRMRNGDYFDASTVFKESYWADLVRLLQAFWATGNSDALDRLLSEIEHPAYRAYVETRRAMPRRRDDEQAGEAAPRDQ